VFHFLDLAAILLGHRVETRSPHPAQYNQARGGRKTWGEKKPDASTRTPVQQPRPSETKPSATPFPGKAKTMTPVDSTYPATSGGSAARVGASLRIKGEITGNEDLQIDGTVEGLIRLEDRKLIVGASAKVTADIIAREVAVYGNVKGNLRARDRIEIKKDGSVVGDLTTAKIMIEDGAYFKGSIEIDKAGDADVEKLSNTDAGRGASSS
jgi:cytoskeletal protein CcmA (bactofilin family)